MNIDDRRRSNGLRPDGAIPLLGGQAPAVGAQISAFARTLGTGGTFPAKVIRLPNGEARAVPDRADFLDAEELLAEIRKLVREELAAALEDLKGGME